ncbi:hypothetical protein Moror_2184 [Moniliophthora roreri MCA 2997]|uniref:Uncharacterized protein n=1 Tax=Moniliophthora roreri (strain MCA 2997) TaxID=1381753 RepID=V2WIT0_MONRO|nr:hypothetical protein Moror_2184 [Moniliophthora roreri MCA 2997]
MDTRLALFALAIESLYQCELENAIWGSAELNKSIPWIYIIIFSSHWRHFPPLKSREKLLANVTVIGTEPTVTSLPPDTYVIFLMASFQKSGETNVPTPFKQFLIPVPTPSRGIWTTSMLLQNGRIHLSIQILFPCHAQRVDLSNAGVPERLTA